jgi:hypothetical protein
LGQIGRGEIDDDPLLRERQPGRMQSAAYPLAALGNRLVGQPNDDEFRQARCDLHLDIDGDAFDPLKRNGSDVRNHGRPGPGLHLHVYPTKPERARTIHEHWF